MTDEPIDLGLGHVLTFMGWHPDRELNPQFAGIADIERCGALIEHPTPESPSVPCACGGFVHFDVPGVAEVFSGRPRWTVVSWEPLTLTPSILCVVEKGGCGDHGYITDGKWVPA